MSLIEQKKIQWAKEREEMSKLSGMFASTTHEVERTSIRTYYSNVDLSSSKFDSESTSRKKYVFDETNDQQCTDQFFDTGYYNQHLLSNEVDGINGMRQYDNERVRSPSLPPIGGRNKIRVKHQPSMPHHEQRQYINTDEDTSGYLSDGRTSPTAWKSQSERSRPRMRLPNENRSKKTLQTPSVMETNRMYAMENGITNDELSSNNNSRRVAPFVVKNKYFKESNVDDMCRTTPQQNGLKTDGNRNGQGRKMANSDSVDDNEHETDFSSIPKTPSSISSEGSRDYSHVSSAYQSINFRKDKEERAKWADRNLPPTQFYDGVMKENAVKSGPCWLERGFVDSGDESMRSYSFIRGQNAPIDPNTLAERTTKRLKAIEFQNAIKEQLRERETIKRLEHERILLEERRQEDRVRKQMEAEQIRVEAEQRKHQDKIETEIKKQMAMKIAIEKARQEAELEKARRRRESHLNLENVATNECNDESNVSIDVPKCEDAPESDNENGHIGAIETPSPTMDIDERHDDDGEKILIGTPIKMKKKTIAKLNLSQHANGKRVESPMATNQMNTEKNPNGDERNADQTDADGIALILQTLPPIVPILGKNDLFNLNQNLSNLNNIQLAVMLAHQMQQLNTTMAQMPTYPKSTDTDANVVSDAVTDKVKCVRCNICGKRQKAKSIENVSNEMETMEEMLQTTRKDVATVTDDIDIGAEVENEIAANDDSLSVTAADSTASINSNDASTQTDDKSIYECCFQCRYHQCHQHHVLLNKLSTKEHGEEIKCNNKLPTANESRPIELKELKEIQRLEDRPKWGVNRPQMQYVKASERDPNYVRNRKKIHKKRLPRMNTADSGDANISDIQDVFTAISRSNSPTPSTITNGTVTLSKSPKREAQLKLKKSTASSSSKRNICTEILPIKTDMNGRVYLNFREASVVMSEDEIRKNLKNRYNKMERIINRGRTIDDTFATHNDNDDSSGGGDGSSGVKGSEILNRKSQRNRSNVEIESA